MSRKIVDEESRGQSRDQKPSMGAERPVEKARTGCHGCRAASLRVTQLRIRIFRRSRDVACCPVFDMLRIGPTHECQSEEEKEGLASPR